MIAKYREFIIGPGSTGTAVMNEMKNDGRAEPVGVANVWRTGSGFLLLSSRPIRLDLQNTWDWRPDPFSCPI